METYQRILVVIDDQNFSLKALERASCFAQITHADIHVVLFSYQGRMRSLLNWFHHNHQSEEKQDSTIQDKRMAIESYVRHSLVEEVNTTYIPYTCFNVDDILYIMGVYHIDTVFVAANEHDFWRHLALPSIDLQLMARSPAPVFVIKDHPWFEGGAILSAVEPLAEDRLHQQLTNKIVEESAHLSQLLHGDCHFVDCYHGEDVSMRFDTAKPTVSNKRQHLSRLAGYCEALSVDQSHIHLALDLPEDAIVRTADDVDSELIIIGTSGQHTSLSKFASHTSQEVIDRVRCDMLVVKPESFARLH